MIEIAPGLVDYIAGSSGAAHVELRGVADEAMALKAMTAARSALFGIPHPEEESEPLPSYASEVVVGDRGPSFRFDIADAEAYEGLIETVVETMASAMDNEGASGLLASPELP